MTPAYRWRRSARSSLGIVPEAKPRLETAVAITLALIGVGAVCYLLLVA